MAEPPPGRAARGDRLSISLRRRVGRIAWRERLTRGLAGPGFWRALALAWVLGALAALAMPPVHFLPILLVSLPALCIMAGEAPGWRRAALVGLFWGWGFHVAGLHWLTNAILTEADRFWWLVPIAVPALALPLGAFTIIPALLLRLVRPGWPRVLAFAGAWTASEMLRGVMFTGFPWNLLGTAWGFAALPIQAAAWIGAYGLSLVTAILVLAPLARRGWWVAGGGVAALLAIGLIRLWPAEPEPQPVTLVLVQGNVPQDTKWREETRWPIFRRYTDLTTQGVRYAGEEAPGNRILAIWPETASPFLLANDAEAARLAAQPLPEGGLLLAGAVRARFEGGRAAQVWNSMVALDHTGHVLDVVDKAHLVPFGEYMPFRGLIPVRLTVSSLDFSAAPGLRTVSLPGIPSFTGLICYEVIFPGAVTGPERPGFLVNITNDAWFGVSAGPYQHLASARFRAVEEGLPIARAAQTGISAVFDARGRVVARLGLAEMGVVVAPLPRPLPPTPFARLGLAIPAGLIALSWILAGLSNRHAERSARL